MRSPTALDAVARWLVLTLAGLALYALAPANPLTTRDATSTGRLLALHPLQIGAIAIIVIAWVIFVVRVVVLRGPWLRDGLSVVLGVLALGAVGGCIVVLGGGPPTPGPIVTLGVLSIGLQVAVCIRVDRLALGRRRASVTGTPAGARP